MAMMSGMNGWFSSGLTDCDWEPCIGVIFKTRLNGSYGS